MNITGPVDDSLGDELLHKLDHRLILHLAEELLLTDIILFFDDLKLGKIHILVQSIGDIRHLGGVGSVISIDGFHDGGLCRDHRLNIVSCPELDIVDGHDIGGVGHGEGDGVPHTVQGDDFIFSGDVFRDDLEDIGIDLKMGEIHRSNAELFPQGIGQVCLTDKP